MYVKLFSQILKSSIARNRKLRHFFTDLLLLADSKGYVVATKYAIAQSIGATEEEVEWGISELLKPDPESKTREHNGCRIMPIENSGYGWIIFNYEHYRSLKDADQLRESGRIRTQKWRENQNLARVTVGDTCHGISEADSEEEAKEELDLGESLKAPVKSKRFTPPTPAEVSAYMKEQGMMDMGQKFCDYYESKGWVVGKSPMKSWKAAVRTWKGNNSSAQYNCPPVNSMNAAKPAQPVKRIWPWQNAFNELKSLHSSKLTESIAKGLACKLIECGDNEARMALQATFPALMAWTDLPEANYFKNMARAELGLNK